MALSFNLRIRIWHSALLAAYSQKVIKRKNQNLVFSFSGYQGKPFSGLVQLESGKSITKLKSIFHNSEVMIQTNLLHSSYFRDEPEQILVYVRPVKNEEDWLGAIAVPLELLSPCRYHNQT